MRKTIAGTFLFLFAVSVSAQSGQTDLALKDIHGHSFKLSDFKGKVVLLNFWATWCPPCRKEIPQLIKLQRKYRKAGLQIIGITYPPEKLSSVRAFAKRSQTNYPLVLGSERTKSTFTSSDVLPVTVVIDRVGKVREVIEGILLPEEIDEKIKPLLAESIPSGPQVAPTTRVARTPDSETRRSRFEINWSFFDAGRRGRLRSQHDAAQFLSELFPFGLRRSA